MCGFKRPALSTAQPLSFAPGISAIDGRLDHLRGMVHSCGCPGRLSYATVDSYIGKLRAIF